jgi:hypothetical protein
MDFRGYNAGRHEETRDSRETSGGSRASERARLEHLRRTGVDGSPFYHRPSLGLGESERPSLQQPGQFDNLQQGYYQGQIAQQQRGYYRGQIAQQQRGYYRGQIAQQQQGCYTPQEQFGYSQPAPYNYALRPEQAAGLVAVGVPVEIRQYPEQRQYEQRQYEQ